MNTKTPLNLSTLTTEEMEDLFLHLRDEIALRNGLKAMDIRTALNECVEALEEAATDLEGGEKCTPQCDKATLAIASRLRQAIAAANDALNGGYAKAGMLEAGE